MTPRDTLLGKDQPPVQGWFKPSSPRDTKIHLQAIEDILSIHSAGTYRERTLRDEGRYIRSTLRRTSATFRELSSSAVDTGWDGSTQHCMGLARSRTWLYIERKGQCTRVVYASHVSASIAAGDEENGTIHSASKTVEGDGRIDGLAEAQTAR